MTPRDVASERTDLADFPRPSVAVDVAVFAVVDGRLAAVLWRRTGRTETGTWALPGSFVRERERLDAAVQRTLADKCGIEGLAPTQLRVMDDPDRDARGWVLSVAHLDVVRAGQVATHPDPGEVCLAPVRGRAVPSERAVSAAGSVLELPGGQLRLPFDHESIVVAALAELRGRYAERPDPYRLVDDGFTILDLRRLHEAIAGHPLQKDTFRRAMLPRLEALDVVSRGTVGRPARLYRRLPG